MATNMSITNCEIPWQFEFGDRVIFRSDIEPKKEHGYTYLNPQALLSKYAVDFHTNKKNQWVSMDPKLISASHGGQSLTLDRPPIDGTIPLNSVYIDKNLDNYGKSYKSYSDINAGHITYYIDKSIRDPFFGPVYSNPSLTTGMLYRDPMGAFRPQYERYPIDTSDQINSKKCSYNGGLSWIEDSQEHREDIISKQMRKHNEQRWEPRWS